MYSITFYVDLRNFDNTLFSLDEVEAFAKTKTTWIPTLTGGNLVKKHGDVFIMYGEDAVYLKNLILNGQVFGVTFSEVPQLTGLTLTLEEVVVISWNISNLFSTEIVLQYDDGPWQTSSFISPGVGQVGVQRLGGSLRVRARFVDSAGNSSPSYSLAEIEYGSIPEATTIFGLTGDGSTVDFEINSTYTNMLSGTPTQFNSWLDQPYDNEYGIALAWNQDQSLLYRIYKEQSRPDQSEITKFESINLDTLATTSIPLTIPFSEDNNLPGYPNALVYYQSGEFIIGSSNSLYKVTTTGTVSEFVTLGEDIGSLVLFGGILYVGGRYSNNILQIDPATGTSAGPNIFVTYTESVYALRGLIVNPNEGSQFVSIIQAQVPGQEESEYVLAEIAIDGTVSSVSALFESSSLCNVVINSSPNVILLSSSEEEVEDILPNAIYKGVLEEVKTEVISFGSAEYDQDAAISWNYDDNNLYHISFREDIFGDGKIVLERLNTETLVKTELTTSGFAYFPGYEVEMEGCSIDDGGDDMYDGANVMITSLDYTSGVQYTHTQQANNNFDTEIADGTIENGATWFGSGSTYFTNLYAGLFVTAVHGMNINQFGIYGNVGADGGGNVSYEKFEVTVGLFTYTVFFKKIYDAGDPSVNHLIIVPAAGDTLTQTVSLNTNEDTHIIDGLSGVPRLYYLLFARANGGEVSPELAESVATTFLAMVDPANLATTLANVNAGANTIVALIPDVFMFSDHSDTGQNTVGEISGMEDPRSMVYLGNDTFMVGADEYLYTIQINGTDGEISQLISTDGFVISGMTFVGEDLWAINEYGPFLIKIDPLTGQFLNEVEDEKFEPLLTYEGNPVDPVRGLASLDGVLYGIMGPEEGQQIISIDTVTGVCTLVNTLPAGMSIRGLAAIGGL